MLPRRAMAISTMAAALSVVVVWSACSTSELRDQNWGKDVATTYIPPEAGIREAASPAPHDTGVATETMTGERDGGDAGADGSPDAIGEGAADTSVDTI